MTEDVQMSASIPDGVWKNALESNTVHVDQGRLRRLHRLFVRAELALEIQRTASAAYQEALVEVFEDGGLTITQSDGYSIDWRSGTLTLKPGGEQQ